MNFSSFSSGFSSAPRRENSGQILLEVMVALFVLTVGFLGILSLLAQSLFLTKTISEETIATYLASEGIEIARNLVDHDIYAQIAGVGTGWGTCFGVTGGSFELDYTETNCSTLTKYLGAIPPDFIYFDPTVNQYLYSFDDNAGNGAPTIFKRGVKVTPAALSGPGANELIVQSTVWWNVGSPDQQSITVEDYFYNQAS